MIRLAAAWWLAAGGAGLAAAAVWALRRRLQRFPFPGGCSAAARGRLAAVATVAAGFGASAAFLPLAVAMARPQEVLSRSLDRAVGVDIVLALDISGTMAALDFEPSNRLGVAREVINGFLEQRSDDRFGLVVFAGAAVTLCPLTLDREVIRHFLDEVHLRMLPDGTAIGLGLGTAVNRLRSSTADSKVIILVTDGANNAGQLDPLTAADLAAGEGITVHTVLVGRGGEVPIPVPERDRLTGQVKTRVRMAEVETNPELLAEIARATGGTSFRARDPQALRQVFDEIDALEKTEFTSTRLVRFREKFEPWAMTGLILLLGSVLLESLLGGTPW